MQRAGFDRTLIVLLGLFIFSILGILFYTMLMLREHQLDAIRVDLAGRQRFLSVRHVNEILLVGQGLEADYRSTRKLFNQTLETLIYGGSAVATLRSERIIHLPPAPSDEIRAVLIEQQRLMQEFIHKADAYYDDVSRGIHRSSSLHELLALNERLYSRANEGVQMLNRYSESRIVAMMKWETGVGLLVVLTGFLLTSHLKRSITERRQSEENVRRSQQERLEALRQSDSLKSALLSSVSHELRTPLTTIKASVSTLFDAEATMAAEVRTEFLDRINQEIDYLAHLVNNLLDMSQIEAGALAPSHEWHPLEDLLEGAIYMMGTALQQRPLEIDLPDERPSLYVDGVLIQQVLINLLDNAVKYSPKGSCVRIEARVRPQECEIRVSNVGIGIPPGELSLVFERFHRVRVRHEKSIPGTGLGLAICKGIIEAHRGRIWAESTPSEMTTVAFILPMAESLSALTLARLYSREDKP